MSLSASTNGRRLHPGPGKLRPQAGAPDLLVLSHLPWDLVTQRPHHLLRRAARDRRVFYVEEPAWGHAEPGMRLRSRGDNLSVVTPELPDGLTGSQRDEALRRLLDGLLDTHAVQRHDAWYYTPSALPFTRHLEPEVRVYDCMDELSLFQGAPRGLRELEQELLAAADVVFTGGQRLYEARRDRHPHVHLFPSSIDRAHFARARHEPTEPDDQASIPSPRIGFFGVIDERMDVELLDAVARARPDWHLVLLGPVVKISPDALPQRPNVHHLGPKDYDQLPAYLAGWDVAMLPFALNDATRFISPTKTPEYLAGGRRVVSTPIHDVVHPYADLGLVRVAGTPEEFVAAVEASLADEHDDGDWLAAVDDFLARGSWDQTWARMALLLESARRRISRPFPAARAAASGGDAGGIGQNGHDERAASPDTGRPARVG